MAELGSTEQILDASLARSLVSLRTPAEQLVLTSYERSSYTFEEYAKKVIAFASSEAEVSRRSLCRRRLDILRDSWGPLLKASLKNWTSSPVYLALIGANEDHIDLSRNPAKHIWQELSVTYKYPPKRTTPSNPLDVGLYNDLLKGTGFDAWWQMVELMAEACNDVLIYPDVITYLDGKKEIKHRVVAGDRATVICSQDDPTVPEAVCIVDTTTNLDGETVTTYKVWTRNWYGTFTYDKAEGNINRIDEINLNLYNVDPSLDESANNPYKELPFHSIHLNPWPDRYWDQTSGEDLIDLTLRGGEERIFYRYLQKMSGFKQAAITGENIEDIPQTLMDPGAIIPIQTDGALQIIDWQLDLKSRLDCMMQDELLAAASRGINSQRYQQNAAYQSSQTARLSERGLEERRTRNSPIFKDAEAAYKRMLCIVAKAHGMKNIPSKDVGLEVEHTPLSYPGDPAGQLSVDRDEIAMGLKSQVDVILSRNPTWTEEQAKKKIEESMEMIAWVNKMKMFHNLASDPAIQSMDAQTNGALGPIARDKKQDDDETLADPDTALNNDLKGVKNDD